MSYTQTMYPNILGHKTREDAEAGAEYLLMSVVESLLGGECNPEIRMLGCSVLGAALREGEGAEALPHQLRDGAHKMRPRFRLDRDGGGPTSWTAIASSSATKRGVMTRWRASGVRTDIIGIVTLVLFCYCNAYLSPQMFPETSCSARFSCKMRTFFDPAAMLRSLEEIPSTAPPWLRAQPIGTLSLWNDLWLAKVSQSRARFFKAWKQSHEEVQKSSFLSEHLNYNMLKVYLWNFCPNDAKIIVAYWSFNI